MDNNKYSKYYYIGVFIISMKLILDLSRMIYIPEYIDNFFNFLFVFFMFIKLINTNYSKLSFLAFIIIGVLCIYSNVKIGNYYLFMSYIGIISFSYIDLKKVLRIALFTKTIILLIHIAYYIYRLCFNEEVLLIYRKDGLARHTFGLAHPNSVGLIVLWILLEISYLYYDQLNLISGISILSIGCLFFYFTDSKTLLITLIITMAMIVCHKLNLKIITKWVFIFSKWGFLFLSIFFYISMVIYRKSSGLINIILNKLDVILSGRIRSASYVFERKGLTFLGRQLEFKNTWEELYKLENIVLDTAYSRLLLYEGMFYLIIFCVGFIVLSKYSKTKEQIFIVSYLLYGISESIITNAFLCFPLLFLGSLCLYNKKKIAKRRIKIII